MKILGISFLFAFLTLLIQCQMAEIQMNEPSSSENDLKPKTIIPAPIVIACNLDSVPTITPGKDGYKSAETKVTRKKKTNTYTNTYPIVPGVSYLKQTKEDFIAGKRPVLSKKPVVTPLVTRDQSNGKPYEKPNKILIAKPITINNIDTPFEDMVIQNRLYAIQQGDTIFPPSIVSVKYPKPVAALPFNYRDHPTFHISYLDVDEGMANSFVRGITEDTKGNIWIATWGGGLSRYDGHSFTHFDTNNGLGSNIILSLLIDKKERIWMGTLDHGVYVFNGDSILHFSDKQGLCGNHITAIHEDQKGNIWIASARNGVSCYNGQSFTNYSASNGLCSNTVLCLEEDLNGHMWFGTSRGSAVFNGERFRCYTKKDGLAENYIVTMKCDHLGNMWLGTYGGGLSYYDGQSITNYTTDQGISCNDILSIIEDKHHNIWLGTFGEGLCKFDGSAFSYYTTDDGLSNNYIRTLFIDHDGSLWLGTDGAGMSHFGMNPFKHFTKRHGLKDDVALSIFEDSHKDMWFGVFENGLMQFDGKSLTTGEMNLIHISEEDGLTDNVVESILEDKQGNMWFATYNRGFSKLDRSFREGDTYKFTNYNTDQGLPSNVIRSMVVDKGGIFWFGTEGGLTSFDGKSFRVFSSKDGLCDDRVFCVFIDSKSNMWIGTNGGGVSKFDGHIFTNYTKDQGLASNIIWTITEDNQGGLWFGSEGAGLTYFDGEQFLIINKSNGISHNTICSIIEDAQGQIWVGTDYGMTLLTTKALEVIRNQPSSMVFEGLIPDIKTFSKNDGLKSLDFYTKSILIDHNNQLWAGMGKSLLMLDLNAYTNTDKVAVIQINDITINEEFIDFRGLLNRSKDAENVINKKDISFKTMKAFTNCPVDLKLPYNLNHLSFDFSAIEWVAPHNIKYQYKLDGLDDKWSFITAENRADYRNLSHGKYIFHVKAMSASGIWCDPISYSFSIKPPWWYTWYAYLIYILVFIFSFWLMVKWRVSFVEKQKAVLSEMVKERTRELNHAMKMAEAATEAKSQFMATMSHEIRTPMNAIMGLSHLALQTKLTSQQKDYLEKIDRSASSLLGIINDILDFSKIEAGKMNIEEIDFDLKVVLDVVSNLNAQKAIGKKLKFTITKDAAVPEFLIGDPLRVGQIITNLCSNAIKFTEVGSVNLKIELDEFISPNSLRLRFSVADTGIGITEDQGRHLFQEFSQADSSTTRKYGGTGLGLTISKLLVELMQGQIGFESEYGTGSIFYFTAVFKVQSERQERKQSTKWTDNKKQKNQFERISGARVLLAEDNEINQQVIGELLQSMGIKVDVVENGLRAVESISHSNSSDYQLVIMDLQMPVMDGLEASREIRKMKSDINLPIIAITADAMIGVKEKCFELGINDIMLKPINPDILYEKLIQWIDGTAIQHSNQAFSFKSDNKTYELPPIEGLNLKKALLGMGNNLELFVGVLRKFNNSNQDSCSRIQKHFEKEDMETAQLMAHSLKGECGHIGAEMLQELAQRLEQAIQDDDTEAFNDILPKIKHKLALLSNAISGEVEALQSMIIEDNKTEKVSQLLDKLTTYYTQKDPKTFDIIDQLGRSELISEEWEELSELIGQDETKTIMGFIEKLKKRYS